MVPCYVIFFTDEPTPEGKAELMAEVLRIIHENVPLDRHMVIFTDICGGLIFSSSPCFLLPRKMMTMPPPPCSSFRVAVSRSSSLNPMLRKRCTESISNNGYYNQYLNEVNN
jgi:hypothetical protein